MTNKLEFLVGEITLAAHSADIERARSAMASCWDGDVVITPIPGEGLAFRLCEGIYSSPEFMTMLKGATASARNPDSKLN